MTAAEWIAQRRHALGLLSAYSTLRGMAGDLTATVAVGSLGIRGSDITAAEDDARESLPRALDALAAVLELHHRRPHGKTRAGEWCVDFIAHGQTEFPDLCDYCTCAWPCLTVDAIESALRGEP